MSQKRFLRDKALDEMLTEIQAISERVVSNEFPTLVFSNSMTSLSEMYETNKLVLVYLEDVIENIRKNAPQDEVLDKIVEAAAHVQLGLVTVHNALKQDINSLLTLIQKLGKTLEDKNIDL